MSEGGEVKAKVEPGVEPGVKTVRRGRAKVADPAALDEFQLRPDPADPRLTERVRGVD